METKKFKCNFCDKTFARKQNRDTHETAYCMANPDSINSKKFESIEKDVKEYQELEPEVVNSKYNEDEQFIIDFFNGKSLSDISLSKEDGDKVHEVYTRVIKKACNRNCNYQMISAFTTLWYKRIELLKRK